MPLVVEIGEIQSTIQNANNWVRHSFAYFAFRCTSRPLSAPLVERVEQAQEHRAGEARPRDGVVLDAPVWMLMYMESLENRTQRPLSLRPKPNPPLLHSRALRQSGQGGEGVGEGQEEGDQVLAADLRLAVD